MADQFTTKRRVQFADTDAAGILHFASFYRYMEETEHAFFRSLGLSVMLREPDGSAIGWPRVSASCTFEAPAYFEDMLEVRMNVARKGNKSLTMHFEIWRYATRVAYGSLTTVCCLCRPGLPLLSVPIPPEIGDKIQVMPSGNTQVPES